MADPKPSDKPSLADAAKNLQTPRVLTGAEADAAIAKATPRVPARPSS